MVHIHRLVVLGFGLGVTSIAPTSAGMMEVYKLTITTGAAFTSDAEIPLSTLIGYDMGEKKRTCL